MHRIAERQDVPPRHLYDYVLDAPRDELFEDDDFLLLYDPSLDGIENDAEAVAQSRLVKLAYRGWFTPFRDDPVAPLETGSRR